MKWLRLWGVENPELRFSEIGIACGAAADFFMAFCIRWMLLEGMAVELASIAHTVT